MAREREGMSKESLTNSFTIPSSIAPSYARFGGGAGGPELGAGVRTSGREQSPLRRRKLVSTNPCKTGGFQGQDPC